MPRKRRPREHIIADLSVNYVEKYILLCGFSVERIIYDYGYDLVIFTYNERGEIENGQIYIQLKSTDSLAVLFDQKTITFSLTRSDLELWLLEPMPCILVVYDAKASQAYWLYIQAYFENLEGFNLSDIGERITVRIPKDNLLNRQAIQIFAKFKGDVLSQLQGVIRHDG
ncbi:DUF4365 domain-containing protein [Calothrix sp. 336/3]|uniref:DUF4365 domain-containing protein n=1 Tax=Calothrix sp. 336/3 TaxID=1337936 RepID=UPI0004E3C1D6|nr:DUF4365 domain-containing protein [Calothrix sp. 336/3]AKG21318.1 hypothetical protein IJ00_08400 [Calothrix sp. 336/3]